MRWQKRAKAAKAVAAGLKAHGLELTEPFWVEGVWARSTGVGRVLIDNGQRGHGTCRWAYARHDNDGGEEGEERRKEG